MAGLISEVGLFWSRASLGTRGLGLGHVTPGLKLGLGFETPDLGLALEKLVSFTSMMI